MNIDAHTLCGNCGDELASGHQYEDMGAATVDTRHGAHCVSDAADAFRQNRKQTMWADPTGGTMNTYEVTIRTESINDYTTVQAETPEAAETAGYEWFDINYWDHRECHEFAVEVVLVAEDPDPAACYRCGRGEHPPHKHVFMSNADFAKATA